MIRRKKIFCLLFILGVIILPLDSLLAVGLIIKPKEINLSGRVGKEIAGEFLVINAAAEPAIYTISPDALAEKIRLEPAEFQLEPNASQLVKVKAKIFDPGRYNTHISVIARPLGAGGLTLASGVKLPLTVEVGGLAWRRYVFSLVSLLIICLLIVFGVKWLKGRSR